jgi:S-(hydroxymethyl)glutathione dehydrogenase / alcohol dehydrogenase
MRAALVHKPHEAPSLAEVAVESPRAGEVLVKIAASGICGSDLHVLHGRSNAARSMPLILGHEGAGVVEEVGPGVTDLKRGDHVVIAMFGPCGRCDYCSTGQLQHCNGPERRSAFGEMADGSTRLTFGDAPAYPFVGVGSLAEYAVVRRAMVVKIPQALPLDKLCVTACAVTTGLGAVFNVAEVRPGSSVVVIGCGGVGLNIVQGAKIAGAARIVGIDKNVKKLDLATDFGTTHVVEASDDLAETLARVKAIAPRGADYAFEVVGSAALVKQAVAMTGPGGTTVMVGSVPWGEDVAVNAGLLFGERRLVGCLGGSNIPGREIPRIVELYQQGRLALDRLVGRTFAFDRITDAIANAERADDARTVVIVDPRLV